MSDTPRTDEVQKACNALGYGSMVVVPEGYPPHDPWELSRILERENTEIIKHNRALLDALEAVEWGCYRASFWGDWIVNTCPSCGCIDEGGHRDDCKLGNALKQAIG